MVKGRMEPDGHQPSIETKGARRDSRHTGGMMPLLSFRFKCKEPGQKRFAVSSALRERNSRSGNREAMLILATGSDRKEMDLFRFQRGNHSTTPLRRYLVSHLGSIAIMRCKRMVLIRSR